MRTNFYFEKQASVSPFSTFITRTAILLQRFFRKLFLLFKKGSFCQKEVHRQPVCSIILFVARTDKIWLQKVCKVCKDDCSFETANHCTSQHCIHNLNHLCATLQLTMPGHQKLSRCNGYACRKTKLRSLICHIINYRTFPSA